MSSADNTLFLHLAGPMQSWGTSSRLQLRRTDLYPSKSGVLGMVLCAMGIRREDSRRELGRLTPLVMGVRVDRSGTLDWDYHTAGAKIGIRQAKGGIKKTEKTKEIETLLSRRQYLYDASFLVALNGDADTIRACVCYLDGPDGPVWPVFLGRKCCVPTEPVFAGTGRFETVAHALSSVPWEPRIEAIDNGDRSTTRTLDTYIEHPPGSPPPDGARLVHDVPRVFGFYDHGSRWVVRGKVTVPVAKATQDSTSGVAPYRDPYGPDWDEVRLIRLNMDNHLCVFCKSPAAAVHHLDYEDVRPETIRSLCKICHDTCSMLEYGSDMRARRIDPSDAEQRPEILRQIDRLLHERRLGRRRELLEAGRTVAVNFIADMPDSWAREDR